MFSVYYWSFTWVRGAARITRQPSNALLGNNGDFYLNLANSDVYNKVSGSWALVANIRGATGATGPQGPPGTNVVAYNNIGTVMSINTTAANLGSVTQFFL
jgi:hypothetical protein